jgi:hypothetical protein
MLYVIVNAVCKNDKKGFPAFKNVAFFTYREFNSGCLYRIGMSVTLQNASNQVGNSKVSQNAQLIWLNSQWHGWEMSAA